MNNTAVLKVLTPQICCQIANNEQRIILWKKRLKLKPPYRMYLLCGKNQDNWGNLYIRNKKDFGFFPPTMNDLVNCCEKVIGFVTVTEVNSHEFINGSYNIADEYLLDCGYTEESVNEYGEGNTLYSYVTSDFTLFAEPKHVQEFYKPCTDPYEYCDGCKHGFIQYPLDVEVYEDLAGCCYYTTCCNNVKKPPRTYCYVKCYHL